MLKVQVHLSWPSRRTSVHKISNGVSGTVWAIRFASMTSTDARAICATYSTPVPTAHDLLGAAWSCHPLGGQGRIWDGNEDIGHDMIGNDRK